MIYYFTTLTPCGYFAGALFERAYPSASLLIKNSSAQAGRAFIKQESAHSKHSTSLSRIGASSIILYLLLNGEIVYNAAYCFQGQNDSHLTKEGAQQALANPQKLSQLAPNIDQIRFTSSPLECTLATSKIICNAIGYDFTNTHTEAWIM